LNRHGQ